MIGNRLRDVIMLVYAAQAFDDCWKLSLNICVFELICLFVLLGSYVTHGRRAG